MQPEL